MFLVMVLMRNWVGDAGAGSQVGKQRNESASYSQSTDGSWRIIRRILSRLMRRYAGIRQLSIPVASGTKIILLRHG